MKKNKVNPFEFKNYFSFIISHLTHTPVGQNIKNLYRFFKRYILVGRIFRITRLVFIYTQTCAYIIFLSTVLLFLVPVISCILLVFVTKNILVYRRCNRYFAKLLAVCDDVVITFGECNIDIEKSSVGSILYFEVTNKPFFSNFRSVKRNGNAVYSITLPYFYSLKRKVLSNTSAKITYNQGAEQ